MGATGMETLGVPLFDNERIATSWEQQRDHLVCIQDPPGLLCELIGVESYWPKRVNRRVPEEAPEEEKPVLARFLVSLRLKDALNDTETQEVITLFNNLTEADKSRIKYPPQHRMRLTSGHFGKAESSVVHGTESVKKVFKLLCLITCLWVTICMTFLTIVFTCLLQRVPRTREQGCPIAKCQPSGGVCGHPPHGRIPTEPPVERQPSPHFKMGLSLA
ncbi:hypothetical protein PoB_007348300 [Plakobranchus ocellatus]|uniref:Uncharacterized protein n=1 Tax=Plakobranchus ocellatus TaxID=259542 RepID=A0AAV4DRM2_9GAST|nr:hypothetical protein PoB_007348300 [Plakobranchus ocellatus]